jgi:hypothetical protein
VKVRLAASRVGEAVRDEEKSSCGRNTISFVRDVNAAFSTGAAGGGGTLPLFSVGED